MLITRFTLCCSSKYRIKFLRIFTPQINSIQYLNFGYISKASMVCRLHNKYAKIVYIYENASHFRPFLPKFDKY